MTLTASQRQVNERVTTRITGTITDEAGDALGADDLTTLVLTIYSAITGDIINSVDGVDILNTGRGSFTGSAFTLTLTPADNQIVDSTPIGEFEVHYLLIEWTWASGVKAGNQVIRLDVLSMLKVPT